MDSFYPLLRAAKQRTRKTVLMTNSPQSYPQKMWKSDAARHPDSTVRAECIGTAGIMRLNASPGL